MPKWLKKWKVKGSKGNEYTVSLAADGSWGCSCPVWKFRRERCKHIAQVQAAPDAFVGQEPGEFDLDIVPARVKCVTVKGNKVLVPLIPLGQAGFPLLLEVLNDLLDLGYGIVELRRRYHLGKEWTKEAIRSAYEAYKPLKEAGAFEQGGRR